jgi:magnesium-protoporphyrin O-methyltransferase
MLDDYRKKGLSATAMAIVDALSFQGIAGSTVLELGCGFGALTLNLVRKGASSGVGFDLSPRMLELAKSLASEEGLSQSVRFELGDAAAVRLESSDLVILDTVLCCYPDVKSLVANSSEASRRFYAISVPDDERLATRFIRLLLPFQRAIFRRGEFRFYIHSTKQIRELLDAKGFKLISKSKAGWIWSVFLFSAPAHA